jgi:hypothetical protein
LIEFWHAAKGVGHSLRRGVRCVDRREASERGNWYRPSAAAGW